jgi:zinc transport system substrate-binding protein
VHERGRKRRRWRRVAVGLLAPVLVASCGGGGGTDRHEVVAAFFPLAATLRGLVGPDVTVRDLTPAGVEPHDLEITTDQMDAVLDAELVVVMGKGFQPAVEAAVGRRHGPSVKVLDRLDAGHDPHVWLDPVLMQRVVGLLADALAQLHPDRRGAIHRRAVALDASLAELDREFRAGLADCDRDVIVTAHDAFGRLARRYGLREEPIAGISPEQEPDPRRVAQLSDLVRRTGTTTVFTETLVSPRVAETLAREAGVQTAVLDPIESPPGGTTSFAGYVGAMRADLRELRRALGCR